MGLSFIFFIIGIVSWDYEKKSRLIKRARDTNPRGVISDPELQLSCLRADINIGEVNSTLGKNCIFREYLAGRDTVCFPFHGRHWLVWRFTYSYSVLQTCVN